MTGNIPEADTPDLDPQEIDSSPDTTNEVGQPKEPQKETPLTQEEIRAIIRDEATRISQSLVAKGENRTQRFIQQQVAALKQSQRYSGLTDQQIQDAAQKIAVDAYTNPQLYEEAGQPSQQPDSQTEMHPTVEAAISMMEARGTIVEEGDPEFDRFVKPLLERGAFNKELLSATLQAMDAKEKRTQDRKSKAAARAPGGGSGSATEPNDISNVNDPAQLYELGERRIQARYKR